jgi:hypothetical protein
MTTKLVRHMITVCYDASKTGAPLHRVVGEHPLCGCQVKDPVIFDAELSYVSGLECAACRRLTL